MSYTPTEWKKGDVITAAKMNKLEEGVSAAQGGSGAVIVNFTHTGIGAPYVADKEFSDVYTAMQNGSPVFFKWGNNITSTIYHSSTAIGGYAINISLNGNVNVFHLTWRSDGTTSEEAKSITPNS